jgi:aspartyl-tRNA(Asn)/glutamyl-tRNA(Gln) amidotransferase subunit C
MTLSTDQVRHIARLARIEISDAETREMQGQLNDIFRMIEAMQKVNTDGIEPMAHARDAALRLREDVVTERDARERYQSVAPQVEQGLYLVPKVIE